MKWKLRKGTQNHKRKGKKCTYPFQNSSDNKQDDQQDDQQDDEYDEDANEIMVDEYSDDFEAASEDPSRPTMPFLKIVFEDLGMKGVTHVTDACIQYLYNGMQMNKGNYKKNYKSFYKCFMMKEIKVTEEDAEVMKHLFANVHDVDFDHDYLCLIGNKLRMKWISYLRLAFYEKYIFFICLWENLWNQPRLHLESWKFRLRLLLPCYAHVRKLLTINFLSKQWKRSKCISGYAG